MNAPYYQLLGPRQLVLQHQELDEKALQPGQLYARTLVSAVSPGTESAAYRGDPPLRPGPIYPRVVGYCNVAEVVAVGPGASTVRPGQRILTYQSHRSAFICPESEVILTVPADLELGDAAVTYLFHLGYSALIRAGMLAGSRVAVVGLGCLGLTSVAVARMAGAVVYAYSNVAGRDVLARRMGARMARRKAEVTEATLKEDGGGTGFDLVINTSNSWADWFLSVRLARKGGTVCVLGFPGRNEPTPEQNPLASQWFYDKQLALVACGQLAESPVPAWENRFTIKRNCAYLLEQIQQGVLPARELVSRRVPASGLESIYRDLDQHQPDLVTALLEWT